RRASVEIDLAFPIGAAAAEGRTFRKTLVLLFVVPALPLEMRPVEFGAIITFTLIATAPEAGTLLAAAILTRAAVLIAALAISSRTRGKAFAMLVLLATLPLETGAAEFGAVFVSTRLPAARDVRAFPTAPLLAFAVVTLAVRFCIAWRVLPSVKTPARGVVAEAAALAPILAEIPALGMLIAAPERPLVTVAAAAFFAILPLARKSALGEFPLTTVDGIAAVLAAARPITPAAP